MTALPRVGEIIDVKAPDPGDEILHSVTSILGVLDKPALVPWAVNETARWLIRYPDRLAQIIEMDGEEEAMRWIAGLRWRTDGLLRASDLGTVFHSLAEHYALEGVRPAVTADLHPLFASKGTKLDPRDMASLTLMLDHFEDFLAEFRPEYLATEVVVFSPRDTGFGYAGTADAIMRIEGKTLIADYKTSRETYDSRGNIKAPYPEVGLQLAAYRHAPLGAVWRARRTDIARRRYYCLSREERDAAVALPPIDGGIAVHITPGHYAVHPVRCGADEYEDFLYVLEVARWQWDKGAQMVGNPMAPPYPIDHGDPFSGLPGNR